MTETVARGLLVARIARPAGPVELFVDRFLLQIRQYGHPQAQSLFGRKVDVWHGAGWERAGRHPLSPDWVCVRVGVHRERPPLEMTHAGHSRRGMAHSLHGRKEQARAAQQKHSRDDYVDVPARHGVPLFWRRSVLEVRILRSLTLPARQNAKQITFGSSGGG